MIRSSPSEAVAGRGAALLLLLPTVVFLPTLAFYLGLASSLAFGTAAAALAVVLFCTLWPELVRTALIDGFLLSVVLATLISAHLLVANLRVPIDIVRGVTSTVLLALVIVGSITLALAIWRSDGPILDRAMKLTFWMLAGVGILGALGAVPFASPAQRYYDKPVFPFTEPSHFALAVLPVLAYCAVRSNVLGRALYLGVTLIILLLLQSLTLAVGWLLIAMICARGVIVPAFIAIMGALTYMFVDFKYYLERLGLEGENGNLSNLVYFQGWELIGESLYNSRNWGIGFQQLGVFGTDVPISRQIYLLLGDYANILDGGFTMAKLVSEFGVFGMIISAALLLLGAKAFLRLRKAAGNLNLDSPKAVLMNSSFATYPIEMLLRGTGYFSSSLLFLIVALRLSSMFRRERKAARAMSSPQWATPIHVNPR